MIKEKESIKKNNYQKGITLMYALLAILLFSVVEVVIFNAASLNYARLKDERSNQQAYLTVSSAAKVFSDAIAGDKVTFKVVEEKNNGIVSSFTIKDWEYKDNRKPGNPTEVSTSIKNFVKAYGESQYYGTLPPTNLSNSYEIKATFGDEKEFDKVNVEMKMDKYDITAVFTNFDHESSTQDNVYYVTVRIPFAREGSNYNPVVEKVDTLVDEKDPTHETVTTTYKVEWDPGNVSIVRGKE